MAEPVEDPFSEFPPHFLVAASSSPNSEYLIRWTHSIAQRIGARWTVLHIESDSDRREPRQGTLRKNLEMARRYGADVVTLPAEDSAAAILDFARLKNVTQIIVGKSGRRRPGWPSRRLITDAIIRGSGDLDVVVLQEKGDVIPGRLRAVETILASPLGHYLAAAATVGLTTAANYAGLQYIGYQAVSIIYLLMITGIAVVLKRLPTMVAAGLSALCWNFFFIPPQFTLSIHRLDDFLMFVMFFVTASVVGFQTSRLRVKEKMLAVREDRMSLLYDFAQSLSEKKTLKDIADTSLRYIAHYFVADAVLVLRRSAATELTLFSLGSEVLNESDRNVAEACVAECRPRGRYTTDREADHQFLPLATPGTVIGAVGIRLRNDADWSQDQEDLLLTLLRSMALSLEREVLAEENQRILMNAESERLSRILLNTVSHELRTPLTTIKGSVTALFDQRKTSDNSARNLLLEETLVAADRLNNVVENLLSMSRLEAGRLHLKKRVVDWNDVVGVAVDAVRRDLSDRELHVEQSEDPLNVEVDFVLFAQVLANILRNVGQHTPEGSQAWVRSISRGKDLIIQICDDGPGVPPDDLPYLCEKFYRGTRESGTGGCGLGLSISKGIVEAHGGTIAASLRRGGGLCIELTVPAVVSVARDLET